MRQLTRMVQGKNLWVVPVGLEIFTENVLTTNDSALNSFSISCRRFLALAHAQRFHDLRA